MTLTVPKVNLQYVLSNYKLTTHPDGPNSCRAIEYLYGQQNYDSGHDPNAEVTAVVIHFHDRMTRTIRING